MHCELVTVTERGFRLALFVGVHRSHRRRVLRPPRLQDECTQRPRGGAGDSVPELSDAIKKIVAVIAPNVFLVNEVIAMWSVSTKDQAALTAITVTVSLATLVLLPRGFIVSYSIAIY